MKKDDFKRKPFDPEYPMGTYLGALKVNNFTLFPESEFHFSQGINIIIGENGTGKSHLLKLAYSMMAMSAEEGRKNQHHDQEPTKSVFQTKMAEKLVSVFRPDGLGRLVARRQGRGRCEVHAHFQEGMFDMGFSFSTNSRGDVSSEHTPQAWFNKTPVFLPTRELLTIYPGFVPMYEQRYLQFEETYRDTCLLLGAPAIKGPREKTIKKLLEPLEEAMNGTVVLDVNDRFYLQHKGQGKQEMPLVAEGIRKLAMISRLIATGALLDKACLFWDEPETNLNPKLIKDIAKVILELCSQEIQIFIGTHSLFLLRELEILMATEDYKHIPLKVIALESTDEGIQVHQCDSFEEIPVIVSLDEELKQSDHFMEVMNA